MNAVQKNLNTLIQQKVITQSTFSRLIGKSPGAVSQWLNDPEKPPSMKAVVQICMAFGLQPSDILSEQDGLFGVCQKTGWLEPDNWLVSSPD